MANRAKTGSRTVIIMGAAGRDFHDFNMVFRGDPSHRVVAFTAAQIPNIQRRVYPPELAGPLYPDGIPIYAEEELDSLVKDRHVDQVVFAYSDISHEDLMHKASRVLAAGAEFRLLGTKATMLQSSKPVVSVCAVRTGAGKSPVSKKVANILREEGLRVIVVRHPMPYGDLMKQTVQRFATIEDLAKADCTIEEMEEYEPHLREGHVVYAGVDYERVLRQAESEADVIVWDGGNNDIPFLEPTLEIVVIDPHRGGHERSYYPGEVNFLRAHVFILTKLDTATPDQIAAVKGAIADYRPGIPLIESVMPLTVENAGAIRGKRVLVIEDGPTITHGGMGFGAGALAAKHYGASELVDPRPYAVGSLTRTFELYPHIGAVLPAMGYGSEQIRELESTIARAACEVVLIATPADLGRVIRIKHPTCRLTYELRELGAPTLADMLRPIVQRVRRA